MEEDMTRKKPRSVCFTKHISQAKPDILLKACFLDKEYLIYLDISDIIWCHMRNYYL